MIKKVFASLLLLMTLCSLEAQNDGFQLAWHGFVNPVFYGDTRQVVAGREGMMLFYPKPEGLDAEGSDTNAVPSFNMLGITARLNLTIVGPDVLGAKMKGFIEGDFTGATDATINMFRLRHAYLDMRWQHNELLMGQYWYPMVVEEIMPGTQPLNMGAPFHPYARYNQIRDYVRFGSFELMATAAFQLDNKSQGPDGASTAYLKHSLIPEMNLMLRYKGEHLFCGVAANMLTIQPEVGHNFTSFVYSAFAKYSFSAFTLKAQAFLNNNLYEGCCLGGYYMNTSGAGVTYSSYTFNTYWLDFARTAGKWRPGVFVGYAKNNDSMNEIFDPDERKFYGRGVDLYSLFRVQPRVEYVAGNGLRFAAEVEYTQAQYLELSDQGIIVGMNSAFRYVLPYGSSPVANTRFILSACYAF